MSEVTVRGFRPSDAQAVVEVINASHEADGVSRRETAATFEPEPADRALCPERHFAVAQAGGIVVGFSRFYREAGTRLVAPVWVLPAWRGKGAEKHLLLWLLSEAKDLAEGAVDVPVWPRQAELAALLEGELGFRYVRTWWFMSAELSGALPPPLLPAGVSLRQFVPGRDGPMLTDLINDAFRDHWGEGTHSLDEIQHDVDMPSFDPRLLLFAEAEGQTVGYVWSWADPSRRSSSGDPVGYVGDLGVVSGYRRRGLGRALLLRALHDLKARGLKAAELDVDGPNASAKRLYESVGFREKQELRWYRRELVPAPQRHKDTKG